MVTTLRPRLHFLLITNYSYYGTCAERGKAAKRFISEGLISILSVSRNNGCLTSYCVTPSLFTTKF